MTDTVNLAWSVARGVAALEEALEGVVDLRDPVFQAGFNRSLDAIFPILNARGWAGLIARFVVLVLGLLAFLLLEGMLAWMIALIAAML